jgi:nitroreductase
MPDTQRESNEWISEFLASRRTTRDFHPRPIAPELIHSVIKDGLTAPSWSNTRPFLIAVAEGPVRDRISQEFLKRWQILARFRSAGLTGKIRILLRRYGLPTSNFSILKPYPSDLKVRSERIGRELYNWIGIARGDKHGRDQQWARNYDFFGAPVALFIYSHKSLKNYAANDAGLMIENLVLSAHARGLGTCLQGAVNIWADVIEQEFEIPKQYQLLYGLAIGYPTDSPINSFQAHRLSPSEIILTPKRSSDRSKDKTISDD